MPILPKDREKHDLIKHMLDALEAPYKELTEWEEKFIESVTEQFENRNWLSDKQFDVLERIYSEKTG